MNLLTNTSFWLIGALIIAIGLSFYFWWQLRQKEKLTKKAEPLDQFAEEAILDLHRIVDDERIQVLQPPSREHSERMAADRRESIRNAFLRFQINLAWIIHEGKKVG